MLRCLVPFVLGILAHSWLEIPLHLALVSAICILAVVILIEIIPKSQLLSFRLRFLPGLMVYVFLFVSGIGLMSLHSPSNKHYFYGNHLEDENLSHFIIRIDELWSERQNSFRSTAEIVQGMNRDGDAKPLRGKIMLYLQKNDTINLPQPGNYIIAENRINTISPPANPHAFDYKSYLAREGIYYQMFLRDGNWLTLEYEKPGLMHYIVRLRSYLLMQLKTHVQNEESLAVASALLLGYRDYIPRELREAYAGTGAMHILAVSGLHVGIIFLVFKFMTSFMLRFPHGRYMQAVTIILLIWLFACLTGLAPSVRRASTMFTMITIGLIFFNKTSIYNIIGGSAFILLLISPNLIHSIGFQLSYMAVVAIIAIQPKLYGFITVNNYILDKVWALITVSFAAQLGTAPLTLYYFNIFPNYFLLTNIIVIPAATLILYTGLLFFVVHPFMGFGKLIGGLLEWIIYLLNSSIHFIQSLPFAISENVLLLHWEKWLLFLLVVFLYQLLNESRKAIPKLIVVLILLQAGRLLWDFQVSSESYLRVYNSGNENWIEKRYGKSSYLLSNGNEQIESFQFNVQPAVFRSGVKHVERMYFNEENYLFYFQDKVVLRIDSHFVNHYRQHENLPKTDLLIVGDVSRLPLGSIIRETEPLAVIFASSFSYYRSLRWEEICEKENWNCYFAALSGAITYYPSDDRIEVFLKRE